MTTASVNINVTEGQIANAIAVAIAESFSPENRDRMLRDVIRAHMSVKANSYDRETLLSKIIGDTIRQQATLAIQAKVAEMAPEIRAVVDRMLGPQFSASVLKQIEASLAKLAIGNIAIDARVLANDEP